MAAKEQSNEWWAAIIQKFQSHVREETRLVDRYEQLCSDVEDPGTRFLIDLILADERRHHDLFAGLAKAALGDGGAPVPAPSRAEAEAILDATEQFLLAEKDDLEELENLRKQLRGGETGMWRMLVEVMSFDTNKHITILEFLQNRLREELEKPWR